MPYRVLSEKNAKIDKKQDELGVLAVIMHLAPGVKSGHNTCSHADSCYFSCLDTSGRGAFSTVQQARINKTRRFYDDPHGFMSDLVNDIADVERKAQAQGIRPVIRLNGTSDILWENVGCAYKGETHKNVMVAFPSVQFYDYTKVVPRLRRHLPANYHLTFSLGASNDKHAAEALSLGFNVAVVLRVARSKGLPDVWAGHRVIDGDSHDFRFLDPRGGYIVGLRAKGRATKETSGFVRSVNDGLDMGRAFVPVTLQRAA